MMQIISAGGGFIGFNPNHDIHINEYYQYCVRLIAKWLHDNPNEKLNITLGNYQCDFNNNNKEIKLDIQYEHTLVKNGGRSVDNIVFGCIDHENGKYLIRIANYDYLNSLDGIIEYSIPNILNVSTGDFSRYLSKVGYIAPTIYEKLDFDKSQKTNTITMFSENASNRRSKFVNDSKAKGLNQLNVTGVFSKESLKQVYQKTKIMVNLHQTDHHHTFEELRVLPALCNGVIIVSEDVPLKEHIPYGDFIVWSSYKDLVDTTLDVQNNYEYFYREIFNDRLSEVLLTLKESNQESIGNVIRR
jgi:hypothetical protein